MDDFFENWTVQVRKGVLELCIRGRDQKDSRTGLSGEITRRASGGPLCGYFSPLS